MILVVLVLAFSSPTRESSRQLKWMVCYSSQIPSSSLDKVSLAILEPDNYTPPLGDHLKTKYIGYLSLGEINKNRSYSEAITKDTIVEANPDWPDAYRVDPRSETWQKLLLYKMIPEILKKGYDGLFLDTIDTASYLEEKDAQKFKGAKQAMMELVKKIRKRFPTILIYPNNGLEFLENYGAQIDGVVVEDLYGLYNTAKNKIETPPPQETSAREKLLSAFLKQHAKPVLNIIYEVTPLSDSSSAAKEAIDRSEIKGYDWYLTTVDLMQIGFVRP